MTNKTAIKLFEEQQVRSIWDEEGEKWYFSIIDVIQILTESDRPRKYWSDLKSKLKKEGSELSEKIGQFKMRAEDGKMRMTDIADTEQLFRLIQSVPSPKAEPFKLWLAQTARERIDEIEDPEKGIDRLMETYLKKGYSKQWINQRLKSIEVRKELTDEWEERGVKKGIEYAILTDEITKAWSGLPVKGYKKFKNLKKENLRDNMTNLELVLNMLAEATTTEISKEKKPETFRQNKNIAKQGGAIAGNTRKEIEEKTGKKVISSSSVKNLLGNEKKGKS
ncbi:MAG TPA: Bro-N domain-containing protein [Flavobacteriaceae bacterium]|nr:Bro-N domain-containing protein [Flavobacteriaceae bacterium]